MLGLFGTVTGMISAFDKIGLGGMGKPEKLAGDIGVALITTAGGLMVGIPAMLAFFIFRGRFDSLLTRVSDVCTELVDLYTGEGAARRTYELRAGGRQVAAPAQPYARTGAQDFPPQQPCPSQSSTHGYPPQRAPVQPPAQ
jgi:hypothetical protein